MTNGPRYREERNAYHRYSTELEAQSNDQRARTTILQAENTILQAELETLRTHAALTEQREPEYLRRIRELTNRRDALELEVDLQDLERDLAVARAINNNDGVMNPGEDLRLPHHVSTYDSQVLTANLQSWHFAECCIHKNVGG
jgi:hypothetical protein